MTKSDWGRFVHYFSPIKHIETIITLLSHDYFFGFFAPDATNELLSKQETGAFLFRFSSHIGYLALSVNTVNGVMHTKVAYCVKGGGIELALDGKSYDSFERLIADNCDNLVVPCNRAKQINEEF